MYTDNVFSGVPLFQRQMEDGIYAAGTVCANRKIYPDELISADSEDWVHEVTLSSGKMAIWLQQFGRTPSQL